MVTTDNPVQCTRCGGPMNWYDKKWSRNGIHPDFWKCAEWLEKEVRLIKELP